MDIIKGKGDEVKSNYSPYEFKFDIEGETRKIECDNGTAESCVPGYSRGDTVIVRRVYSESAMALPGLDAERMRKMEPGDIKVVSVGPEVKDLKVGDIVDIAYSPQMYPIYFKDNPRTILKTKEYFAKPEVKTTGKTVKIKMVEYATTNSHSIKHVYRNDPDA